MTMVSEIRDGVFPRTSNRKANQELSDNHNAVTNRPVVDEKLDTHRAFRLLMFVYVLLLVLTEVFYIMPTLFEHHWTMYGVIFVTGLYFFIGFMHGAVRCILQNPSIKGVLLANKVAADWTYCVICETERPPRTHHCHVCDTCVLRRDHHCMLLAQCIGGANWHFFFSGLVFGLLGSALATWLNLRFLFASPFLPSTWSTRFRLVCLASPPGLLWLLRQLSLGQSLVFMLTSSSLMLSVTLAVLIVFYLRLIASNQTMSDRFPGRQRRQPAQPAVRSSGDALARRDEHQMVHYRVQVGEETASTPQNRDATSNWRANMSQFLGDNWLKTVFFPFFSSHQVDRWS